MNEQTDKVQQSARSMELNVLNTILALDRTLLAWVRTALSLLGFGFALGHFVHPLITKGYISGIDPEVPRILGIGIMLVGVMSLMVGSFEYWRSIKTIRGESSMALWSASLSVTFLLIILSAVCTGTLIFSVGLK